MSYGTLLIRNFFEYFSSKNIFKQFWRFYNLVNLDDLRYEMASIDILQAIKYFSAFIM